MTLSQNIESISSPRLNILMQSLKSGNAKALDIFWDEITGKGTPLIETHPEDDEYSLVTFLWLASKIKGVSVISLLTNPTTHPMERLLETDLWYLTCKVRSDVRATYQFVVQDDSPSSNLSDHSTSRWTKYQHDPFNPNTFNFFTEDEFPMGIRFTRSIIELPDAKPQPYNKPRANVTKGHVEIFKLKSRILGNERRVWIYTPPNYDPKGNILYRLLMIFDGWAYANLVPTFTILDNLIADNLIPPLVAVFPDSPEDADSRLQELILHKPFNDFLATELIPWVRNRFQVTSQPSQTIVGGSSAGGLAAAYAAFEHPEIFGNVLAQSGAFAFSHQNDGESEWLTKQFAEKETLPIKFHLDAGILEVNSLRDIGNGPNLLTATRHLHDVLSAKNYNVHYAELGGGHDYISWQGAIPDALQFLIGTQVDKSAQ